MVSFLLILPIIFLIGSNAQPPLPPVNCPAASDGGLDVILIIDNSVGLGNITQSKCSRQQELVADVIGKIKGGEEGPTDDGLPETRVGYYIFGAETGLGGGYGTMTFEQTISLTDEDVNELPVTKGEFLAGLYHRIQNMDCSLVKDQNTTDLYDVLDATITHFDDSGSGIRGRKKQIVILSNRANTKGDICTDFEDRLIANNFNVMMLNIPEERTLSSSPQSDTPFDGFNVNNTNGYWEPDLYDLCLTDQIIGLERNRVLRDLVEKDYIVDTIADEVCSLKTYPPTTTTSDPTTTSTVTTTAINPTTTSTVTTTTINPTTVKPTTTVSLTTTTTETTTTTSVARNCDCIGGIVQLTVQYTGRCNPTITTYYDIKKHLDEILPNCVFWDVSPGDQITCTAPLDDGTFKNKLYFDIDSDCYTRRLKHKSSQKKKQSKQSNSSDEHDKYCTAKLDTSCDTNIIGTHSKWCGDLTVISYISGDGSFCDETVNNQNAVINDEKTESNNQLKGNINEPDSAMVINIFIIIILLIVFLIIASYCIYIILQQKMKSNNVIQETQNNNKTENSNENEACSEDHLITQIR